GESTPPWPGSPALLLLTSEGVISPLSGSPEASTPYPPGSPAPIFLTTGNHDHTISTTVTQTVSQADSTGTGSRTIMLEVSRDLTPNTSSEPQSQRAEPQSLPSLSTGSQPTMTTSASKILSTVTMSLAPSEKATPFSSHSSQVPPQSTLSVQESQPVSSLGTSHVESSPPLIPVNTESPRTSFTGPVISVLTTTLPGSMRALGTSSLPMASLPHSASSAYENVPTSLRPSHLHTVSVSPEVAMVSAGTSSYGLQRGSIASPVALPSMSSDAVPTVSGHSPTLFLTGTSSPSPDRVSSLSMSSLTSSRSSPETLPSSPATTLLHNNYAPPSTVLAPVSPTHSRQESQSSLSWDSELSTSTSPRATSYTTMETFISTSKPSSSEVTSIQMESLSTLSPGLTKSSTSDQTNSCTNTSCLLYSVPTEASSVFSKTDILPSSRTPIPYPSQFTNSPDFSTRTIARLFASSTKTDSSEVTITTHTSPSQDTTQDTLTWETSTTRSWAGSHSPGPATMSMIAGNLPSSTFRPLSSSVSTTTGSSTSPALPRTTSSPATHLGTESIPTEGSLMTLSVLESSTQPVKTSVSPTLNIRAIESIDSKTDTSAFAVPPPSTQFTKPDDTVERHTKKPNGAAPRGTAGPVEGPLAATSPAGSKGPATGRTGRAETTPLQTTATPSFITWISIPTSEDLKLQISGGTISAAPEAAASSATGLREPIASTAVPGTTPSPLNREPEATALLVPSPGAQTRSAVPTLAASSPESDSTASQVTQPEIQAGHSTSTPPVSSGASGLEASLTTSSEAVTTAPFSRTSPNVPRGRPHLPSSMDTSPGTESASAVPTMTASPDILELVTSQLPSSGTDTSSTKPTQTPSDKPGTTASLATSHGTPKIPTTPNPSISPDVSEGATSLVTSSGRETTTTPPAPTASPGHLDTSWVTQAETEASSFVSAETISPEEPDTTTSRVTHPAEASTAVPRTTLGFSQGESDTMPSTAAAPGEEAGSDIPATGVPPDIPDTVISLATPYTSVTIRNIPTLTVPAGEPETTASLVTHAGPPTGSPAPALTVSPRVPGTGTAWVTGSGAQTSLLPTRTLSPDQPETTASWVTHPGSEASSAAPTLTASPSRSETTESLGLHPTETSPAVPRTTRSFPPSESDTTPSTALVPGEEASSAVSASTVSPQVQEAVTSPVTSSLAVTGTSPPSLALSSSQSDTAASWVTQTGEQTSAAVLTRTVPPGGKGLVTSLVTRSGTETSTTTPALTLSPDRLGTTTSRVPHPGAVAGSAVPTPTVSPGEPAATAGVTRPTETSPAVPRPPPGFPQSGSDTTPSAAASPGTEASSAEPVRTASPEAPEDTVTPQVTSSELPARMTLLMTTLSPGEPETTASWATPPRAQTSTKVPASTLVPPLSETTASLSLGPGAEVSTGILTHAASRGGPETTTPLSASPATETSRANPGPTVTTGAPEEEAASLSTRPGTETSHTVPAITLSPDSTSTPSAPSPSAEASTGIPAPTIPPSVPGLPSAPTPSEPPTRAQHHLQPVMEKEQVKPLP
ncbi:mucin-16-like, partial [Ictidomys tridecemlineatus]